MRVRGLDANGDWVFGISNQAYVKDDAMIAQMIKTRIMSFLGDCFFAGQEGIDWFNLLERGTENETALERSISLTILQTEGVVGINSVDLTRSGRSIIIAYDIRTIFSASYQQQLEVAND